MNKGTRLIKRLVALFLVLLLSIESFAAVVSDNDGSAFITKAEFDSLKNNFQSQIEKYNASIDSKIDGAIASFLAGLYISKVEIRKPLINNYNQMRWQADWRVYGEHRSWTNNHTYTRVQNKWFTPHADRRSALRLQDRGLQIFDNIVQDMVSSNIRLQGTITKYDRCCWGHWGGGFSPDDQPPSIFYLGMNYDATIRDYVPDFNEPYMNFDQVYADWTTYPHKASGASWQWAPNTWEVNGSNFFSLATINPGEVIKYNLNLIIGGGIGAKTITSTITTDEVNVPSILYPENAFRSSSVKASDKLNPCIPNRSASSYWNADTNCPTNYFLPNNVNEYLLSYSTQLKNAFRYMMLGADSNAEVNLSKALQGTSAGPQAVVAATDLYAGGNVSWVQVNVSSAYSYVKNLTKTNDVISPAVEGKFQFPLLPVDYIKNVNQSTFRFKNNAPLKFGQGLPLIENINKDGYIKLSFNYDVKYILDDSSATSNKDIYLDIKKNDFIVSNVDADYIDAYVGLVDPQSTSESIQKIKQFKYPNKTGKVELTIPVKNDDELWFRMRPHLDELGYYVTMSNMKIEYVTE